MATLPGATTRIDDSSGPVSAGTKYLALLAPVASMADYVPRLYSNSASMAANHGYARGVDYAAAHMKSTGLPILFVPMVIATPGTVGRINQSGNTGTSVVTVATGAAGSLDEIDGVVKVVTGGTVGISQIVLSISLDGGRTFANTKLGTANSLTLTTIGGYSIGLILSFAAGTLVAGDTVLTFHSTAPMWDSTGMAAAKTALANQPRLVRDWLVDGELSSYDSNAQALVTAINSYETSNERYSNAEIAVRDRYPVATLSQSRVSMSGGPSVTFAASGYTITRGAGSFISDGFVVGDTVRVTGSTSNNVTLVATGVTATVLTFASGIANEGPKTGITITSEPTLTFAEVGATGDTCTRSRGSWFDDGFRANDVITITGTSQNNTSGAIASLTATVITMGTTDLNPETIGAVGVSIVTGESKATWVSNMNTAMASVAAQKRVNLGLGRARVLSPFLGGLMRRSVIWDDSIRAYQHDVHIATFEKDLGPTGADLNDANGNLFEFDERVDGGALDAGFTCYRTWSNGPSGAFIALSLTRANDSSPLSRRQNMAVANLAQSVCQAETENAIGRSLILNSDGTPKAESLATIKQRVDSALRRHLLANVQGEGPRASDAYWTPDGSVDLRVPGATLTGVLTLNLRGTLEHIATSVKVGTP